MQLFPIISIDKCRLGLHRVSFFLLQYAQIHVDSHNHTVSENFCVDQNRNFLCQSEQSSDSHDILLFQLYYFDKLNDSYQLNNQYL